MRRASFDSAAGCRDGSDSEAATSPIVPLKEVHVLPHELVGPCGPRGQARQTWLAGPGRNRRCASPCGARRIQPRAAGVMAPRRYADHLGVDQPAPPIATRALVNQVAILEAVQAAYWQWARPPAVREAHAAQRERRKHRRRRAKPAATRCARVRCDLAAHQRSLAAIKRGAGAGSRS